MKKSGLVGGMGPESTIPYYHDIVYGVQQALGKPSFPELTIESVNVFKVLKLCSEKKYDELAEYLMDAIHNLAESGVDFAALSANMPHIVFDRLKDQSPIPLISIVEAACEEGIQVVIPPESEMELINEKISNELELGIVKEETLSYFQKVISRMKDEDGIEAIVLGCTELPLLLNDEVSSVPCLDTMQIHIRSIIKTILD